MSTNLDRRNVHSLQNPLAEGERSNAVISARELRQTLLTFVTSFFDNGVRVRLPPRPEKWIVQGQGHFHLVPELFLQVSGSSHFVFPQGELELDAGDALLVPPRLMHDELIGTQDLKEGFQNLVIYVDGSDLTCHIARETDAGRPGIQYLESVHHSHIPRMHDWLIDAAKLGWEAESHETTGVPDLVFRQISSLVAAACAGALRILNNCECNTKQEPEVVTKLRMWIENQLGDPELSIRRLAEQARCTPDYLSYLFSQTTGEQLVGYIVRRRLDRASALLAESSLSGKEIAWACGFSTQSYFVRTFHKHFGTTPKAWRNRRREDLVGRND